MISTAPTGPCRLELPDDVAGIDAAALEAHYGQATLVGEVCVLACRQRDSARPFAIIVPDITALRERRLVNVRDWIRFELETLSASLPAAHRLAGFALQRTALPRTAAGTIDRVAVLTRIVESPEPVGPTPPTLPGVASEVARLVEREIARLAARRCVGADDLLEADLGLDSIARVELVAALEAVTGRAPAADALTQALTVRDMIEAFEAGAPSRGQPGSDPWARLLAQPPGDTELASALGHPTNSRLRLLHFALWLVRHVVRPWLRIDTSGLEHLPPAGPFILCPNHQSHLDAFVLSAVLPARLAARLFHVAAAEYFATPALRRIARTFDLVPIDPDSHLVAALQAAAEGLRRGRVLVLFPEGERTIDGTLKRFRPGGAILALELRVPLVPVAITGTYDLWPRGRGVAWSRLRVARPHLVGVRFGAPLVAGTPGVPAEPRLLAERLGQEVRRLGAFDDRPREPGALDVPVSCASTVRLG